MLWKKESSKKDALYVDVFALNGGQALLKKVFQDIRLERGTTFNKNDSTSLEKRMQGNGYYRQGNWNQAMELYNESLCFAKPRSQNISLAYANRSACFLKMKMYQECLIDIDLAKMTGYPNNLMPKIDDRKLECMKLIGKVGPGSNDFRLSFEPNEYLPCMANVLEIKKDTQGDFALFANEDIDVGQTVVVEKAFLTYLFTRHTWKCNICLKENANLLPCEMCTAAMNAKGMHFTNTNAV